MNTNYSNIIKYIISLCIIIVVSYTINSILYFILPSSGINYQEKVNQAIEYRKYYVKDSFKSTKIKKIKPHIQKVIKPTYKLLSSISLQAIYALGNNKGFIIIKDNANNTHMLGKDEEYKGYKLDKIFAQYVIFIKNSIEYKLFLDSNNKIDYSVKSINTATKKIEKTIVVKNNTTEVTRSYLNSYVNNFDKIWKDIAINEVRNKNGQIDGFKVTSIKKGTAFSKLGLKKNDIIKFVNNVALKSYNDAFKVYKQINKIKHLNILILRNNKELELNYEIK